MFSKFIDRARIVSGIEHRILGGWYRHFAENDGIDIMRADWDTLIILDACRYDTLVDVAPKGWPEIEKVRSRASNTWNFYIRNFQEGPYNDTVAVTAQPRTVQIRGDAFHDIVPVYEDDWDDELGTVPPDVMAERTLEVHERYSDKRVLAHWVQPHYPFIGSDEFTDYKGQGESIWQDLKRGNIDANDEVVYRAYQQTLQYTVPHVSRVNEQLTGKIVVSSDHGNAFGTRKFPYPLKIYGHPRDVFIPGLVEVPWVVFENGDRRAIKTDSSRPDVSVSRTIDDRLSDLGYLE